MIQRLGGWASMVVGVSRTREGENEQKKPLQREEVHAKGWGSWVKDLKDLDNTVAGSRGPISRQPQRQKLTCG